MAASSIVRRGDVRFFAELLTNESNRGESDNELSSDESRCLEEIDAVLSPDKNGMSNFIYANSIWPSSMSPSNNTCLQYSTHHHQQQAQMITLKTVNNEPRSPSPDLVHDGESSKTVATIHRRPMLVAFTDPEASSPTGLTQFKCTQCYEIFDSPLLGQEHANNGMCTSNGAMNVRQRFDFFHHHHHHSEQQIDVR